MPKYLLFFPVGMILLVAPFGCGVSDDDQTDIDSPGSSVNPPPVAPPDFGKARIFQLEDLDGRLVSLNHFRNQVVAINFWATWCKPCREEIPDLVKIQGRFRNRGFTVLGLTRDVLNQNGRLLKDSEAVQSFAEEFNINYPVLWDTENIFSNHYGGVGMPTTIILDRNHRIRFRHTGIIDSETLAAEITIVLNEP